MFDMKARFTPTADGCFIDTGRVWVGEDGKLYHLEWTPTLNTDNPLPWAEAVALAKSCELAGHGWQAPNPHELQSLVDYGKFEPASDAPDTKSRWYWTNTPDPSSPSVYAFLVNFYNGFVYWYDQYGGGLVRACRRVPASQ